MKEQTREAYRGLFKALDITKATFPNGPVVTHVKFNWNMPEHKLSVSLTVSIWGEGDNDHSFSECSITAYGYVVEIPNNHFKELTTDEFRNALRDHATRMFRLPRERAAVLAISQYLAAQNVS